MKRMKILFAKGNSQYGTLRDYTDYMMRQLECMGHEVVCVDRLVEGAWENVVNLLDDSFDLVLSFQVLAYKIYVLLEQAGITYPNLKYVSICGDHPIYINYWLNKMVNCSNAYLILADENQYSCIKEYYPYIKAKLLRTTTGKALTGKKWTDRKYDVYFGGSYYDMEQEYAQIQQMEEVDKYIADEIIELILKNEGLALEKAMKQVIEREGIHIEKRDFMNTLEKYIPVDRYLRGKYRNDYIEAALKSGAEVTVCGNHWDECDLVKYSNFNWIGAADMEEAYRNMADSKMMINVMPWSRIGFHDRIVNAVTAGSICITNTNPVIEEIFQNGKEIVGIGLKECDKVTEFIDWALHNPLQAEEIAKAGEKKGRQYFNIEDYCRTVLHLVEEE